jgi:hypothetical protein
VAFTHRRVWLLTDWGNLWGWAQQRKSETGGGAIYHPSPSTQSLLFFVSLGPRWPGTQMRSGLLDLCFEVPEDASLEDRPESSASLHYLQGDADLRKLVVPLLSAKGLQLSNAVYRKSVFPQGATPSTTLSQICILPGAFVLNAWV